ncbi:MAG: transglutaminase-like domain-containing protein [Sulfolobales archaeon]
MRKSLTVFLIVITFLVIVYLVEIPYLDLVRAVINDVIDSITNRRKVLELQNEVERLKSENEMLRKDYESQINQLKMMYEARINQLQDEVNRLNTLNNMLRENLTYYMDALSKLSSEYSVTQHELVNLQNKLKSAVFPAELFTMTQDEVNNFLIKSINSVSNLSRQFETRLSVNEFLMNVFEYVMNSTYYQYDSIAIRSENTTKSNYWKLANETLVDLGGDCEDLAVLVYSIIKPYINNTYLLEWYNDVTGHVAVITYVNGFWYVVDPAGDWLNGYTLLIRLTLKDRLGREWVWWLLPTHIHPDIKKLGIQNSLFIYEWVRDNKTVTTVKGYLDSKQLLQDWLNYWREEAGDRPRLALIGLDTFYKDLTLNELIQTLGMLVRK